MVKNRCIICKSDFNSQRISKLCCCESCEKIRKSNYDYDRYLEFRNAKRKKKRQMLCERYSIASSNLYKLEAVCDECLTKFYWDYTIYENFENTYTMRYNSTEYGAACCPNCGLVQKSIYDEGKTNASVMSGIEQKLYFANLHKNKNIIPKRQAIYIRNVIDFIAEAEDLRKKRNHINNIGELTQEEINLCIKMLFERLKNEK